MNAKRLPGIRFDSRHAGVSPTAAKFKGQTIPGIRFAITTVGVPAGRTSLVLIDEIRRQHPRDFAWGPSIDRLTGRTRCGSPSTPAHSGALDDWDRDAAAFAESRKPYLLYP
jgi:uncharacterized protein YbbC (DUF1343 family)